MTYAGREVQTIRAKGAAVDLLAIGAVLLLCSAVVNPVGNFPLNDDWSYGTTVKRFVETGEFRPLGWTAMPLLSNVIWGALFCYPLGFSFTALRVSTLVASFLGAAGLYVILRDIAKPRGFAVGAALVLALNPIYFCLANTFMTDVPFTATAVWATVFLSRHLSSRSSGCLLIGSTLAVVATLSRQLAFCIPAAFAVVVMVSQGLSWKSLGRASVPGVSCILALVAFNHWLEIAGRTPALYDLQQQVLVSTLSRPDELITYPFMNLYIVASYLGLFTLPVLLVSGPLSAARVCGGVAHSRRASLWITAIVAVSILYGAALAWSVAAPEAHYSMVMPQPLSGNILVESGVGPLNLRDVANLKLENVIGIPRPVWILMTMFGGIGAAVLVYWIGIMGGTLVAGLRRDSAAPNVIGAFATITACIYLAPLLGVGDVFYDRYIIPAIPLLVVGLASVSTTREQVSRLLIVRWIAGAVAVFAFGILAVAGTRDYLAWNRVRWEALSDLRLRDHINATEIDGGFEFNGLYFFDPRYRARSIETWWWVQGDTYVLGFGALPGYEIVREYPYRRWLLCDAQSVFVLRRK